MDPESAGAAGLVGLMVISLRIAERFQDKKSGSSSTSKLDTRMALAEQQMQELRETMVELKDKVIENLRVTYELKNALRVHQAVEQARREQGGNSQNDPSRRDQ